ncbi:MAG: DUF427 domain-containing protein [Planctomycetota bacterium]
MKATWNGATIAQSDDIVVVDGNPYFPLESIAEQHFEPSDTTTVCGWKGVANYYSIVVDGERNPDAAWIYREPKPDAEAIRERVAFWKGVSVED